MFKLILMWILKCVSNVIFMSNFSYRRLVLLQNCHAEGSEVLWWSRCWAKFSTVDGSCIPQTEVALWTVDGSLADPVQNADCRPGTKCRLRISTVFRLILDNMFYHINCGAIQEFPALRKAFTTHVKKYRIFSRVDIANQLLTRHSPLAPLSQVDEWTANPSQFLMQVVCLRILELRRLIRIADRQWGSNFCRRGRKPVY